MKQREQLTPVSLGISHLADPGYPAQKHDAITDRVVFVRIRVADYKYANIPRDGIHSQRTEGFRSPRAELPASTMTSLFGSAEVIP
jgi:hypothetical protein